MGLFGNRDEINLRLHKATIKAICSRSFMGSGLDCDSDYYGTSGDTLVFAQRMETPQIVRSIGGLNSCVIASITRYGSFTIELHCWDYVSEEKQRAFPLIQEALERRGYSVYYKNKNGNDSTSHASIYISHDGSTSATWQEDLSKMFTDVALYAMKTLERY